MNVNTYGTTPIYEGIISGNNKPNCFIDRHGDTWFRVEGERFLSAESQSAAIENHFASKLDESVPLLTLYRENIGGKLTHRP